jgi:hypothetical protein
VLHNVVLLLLLLHNVVLLLLLLLLHSHSLHGVLLVLVV